MREFQQSAQSSASNDLHARLCANTMLREQEMDAEVDVSNKNSLSVRQLLTIDQRCMGAVVREKREDNNEEEGKGSKNFTGAMKRRNITSWRKLDVY